MMLFKRYILLSIIVCFLFLSCKKETEALPVASNIAIIDDQQYCLLTKVSADIQEGKIVVNAEIGRDKITVVVDGDEEKGYVLAGTRRSWAVYHKYDSYIAHTERGNNNSSDSIYITNVDYSNNTISGHMEAGFGGGGKQQKIKLRFTDVPFDNYTKSNIKTKCAISAFVQVFPFVGNDIRLYNDGITLTIQANCTLGNYLRMKIPANVTPGTYPYEGMYHDVNFGGSSFDWAATSGQLVIDAHDTVNRRITGSFEYECFYNYNQYTRTYNIKEGRFDFTY